MSLRLTFNLILIAVFLLGILSAGIYYRAHLQSDAMDEVQHNSQVLMETALAIRSYTTDQIKPHLDPLNATQFLPQTVPAFAATETLRRLSDRYPGYDYKESVLNPTNPRDRASDWERALIEHFRADGGLNEQTGIHGEGVEQSMYVARPITIKQRQCLTCHSTPDAAPATILPGPGYQPPMRS